MTTDPASQPLTVDALRTRIVDEGMRVRATGSLTSVDDALWLSDAPGLHSAASAPNHAVRVHAADIAASSTATPLLDWATIDGTWRDGAIHDASARAARTPLPIDYSQPPLLDHDTSWPEQEPSWWRDRSVNSPTSRAFNRAAEEGLIHAHSHHRSAAGHAFVVTTPDPERARAILEPAYGASLALVSSTQHPPHESTAEIEAAARHIQASHILALGSVRGSDFQRYQHLIVDRITPELVNVVASLPDIDLLVEAIAEPARH